MNQSYSSRASEPQVRRLALAACFAASVCAILAAVRIYYNISFVEPLQYVSSGDEQSSLFAIWKTTKGLSPYSDRFSPPFALASYNWLFYKFYGGIFSFSAAFFSLDDAWLPTVGRILTVLGSGVAGLFSYLIFSDAVRREKCLWLNLFAGGFALIIAMGPLVGFWLITVRPDVWAAALEIIGIYIFVRYYPRKKMLAVVGFATFFYLAWAFKQTAVLVGGGLIVYMLIRRDWSMVVFLAVLMIISWGLTLLLGGNAYQNGLLYSGISFEYSFLNGFRNFLHWIGKLAPGGFGIIVLVFLMATKEAIRRILLSNPHVMLSLSGFFVSLSFALPASAQTGAAENYFFQTALFSAYLTIAGTAALKRIPSGLPLLLSKGLLAGCAVLAFAVGTVLAGVIGVKDLTGQHQSLMEHKTCLDNLPRPLFVGDVYLSLPWMTPGSDPYVLSYFYKNERALKRNFEGNGIGGRIDSGYFAALALYHEHSRKSFDYANLLGNYQEVPKACGGLDVWLRK